MDVHVCEDHDELLRIVHRCIGSKRLPFEGLRLFHFDAHPDLLLPLDLPASQLRRGW
eukprot:m.355204 g.355204  ORF g.355204 m.355204 type:complete len:57 (-) comp19922_c0_seq4:1795-1965(-)